MERVTDMAEPGSVADGRRQDSIFERRGTRYRHAAESRLPIKKSTNDIAPDYFLTHRRVDG